MHVFVHLNLGIWNVVNTLLYIIPLNAAGGVPWTHQFMVEYLLQLRIHWRHEEVLLPPYTCILSATSPAPAPVQKFVANNSEAISWSEVRVDAVWSKPLEINGVLSNYTICLARTPLVGNELAPEQNTSCINVSVSHYENLVIIKTMQFFTLLPHLRIHN